MLASPLPEEDEIPKSRSHPPWRGRQPTASSMSFSTLMGDYRTLTSLLQKHPDGTRRVSQVFLSDLCRGRSGGRLGGLVPQPQLHRKLFAQTHLRLRPHFATARLNSATADRGTVNKISRFVAISRWAD